MNSNQVDPVRLDTGRLIVLLCTERSGSTLLTMMLGGHQRIFAPPEIHLFRYADFDAWQRGYPKAIASLSWFMEKTGQPADPAALTIRFKNKDTESIYRELLALCGPNRFLVDKTPAYVRDPQVLERIERLQPLYIWLVRHPLGVAASFMTRRQQSDASRQRETKRILKQAKLWWARMQNSLGDFSGRNLQEHLHAWYNAHARIEQFLARVPRQRWRRVHYEQIVRSPRREMEQLCAWLGIEPEPGMLRPRENAPPALRWDLGDEQVLEQDRIDAGIADRWRERFNESVLDDPTSEMLRRLQKP